MGNPPILHDDGPVPVQPAPPPSMRLLWRVYPLRRAGRKLDRDRVLMGAQIGDLSIIVGDTASASLKEPSGYPTLLNLYNVQLRKFDSGGMLLRGTEMCSVRGGFEECVQTWWCVPHSARKG